MKKYISLFKKTYEQWMLNNPFEQSAVIAYYTFFSLPSLLVIVVAIAGYFFGQEDVRYKITNEINSLIGNDTAKAIEGMITNAMVEQESTFAIIMGIAVLLFGATGAFFQLKKAMNRIWSVRVKKESIKRILLDRVISFGMILVIGLMLLISLVLSALITYLSEYLEQYAPGLTSITIEILNFLLSYVFIGALFASVFKLLPDINVRWKVTLVGASLTTLLFLIGKYALSFYFGQSEPTSVYGGASSVVLILLWVFYTCLIMFFGAEFTVQYALMKNEDISPNRFSEPAIYQELQEIEERKIHLRKKKKDLDKLANKAEKDS
ncbi:YihY/virulence factor BrkB family protein [Mesonia maritima]|uniref:Membrane protein n=1 Tax=Mesonia maritima TaxID=1793873 RepID=A0ABU1K983_9FLAO|nr:YihY/virulence factor BrkB family protein [Mesonia maritima]MDR6302164.1 membrane protein [Mesonia maritima]